MGNLVEVSSLGKIISILVATVTAIRCGPTLFQRYLDLLPYAANKIRSMPFAWRIAAINGGAAVRIAQINAEAEIIKAEQKLKRLREQSHQSAELLTMPEKIG